MQNIPRKVFSGFVQSVADSTGASDKNFLSKAVAETMKLLEMVPMDIKLRTDESMQ